ncbi:PAS domain S-box-containing protein [Natronincola peptidivorans]|uniref:histidine kinase n=1 Tax=Natronincola peptidivorans TaxID=426128 RepID=A0A1I0HGB4_9FIRM|nr:MASE3 domain-containing protein [Natronincola peptidivorans]SET82900.1 PAS domain S-box-containing protein [Natronincola peptidivorans]
MIGELINKRVQVLIYALCIGLFFYIGGYISKRNLLLFHTLAELFAIFVAVGIVFISINAYKVGASQISFFIGIGYGFVIVFDLLHTFAFEGLAILSSANTNICTQLWIVARYYEAFTMLIVTILFSGSKKLSTKLLAGIYSIAGLAAFMSIFIWGNFPVFFEPDSGTTLVKALHEVILIGIFITSTFLLVKNRQYIVWQEYLNLLLSLITTIISETLFLSFTEVNNPAFVIGHILKVFSFYFLYKAFIDRELQKPYYKLRELNLQLELKSKSLDSANTVLHEEINRRKGLELDLIEKENILKAILDSSECGICVTNQDSKFVYKNNKLNEIWGIPPELEDEEDAFILADYLKARVIESEDMLPKIHKIIDSYCSHIDYMYFKDGKILERSFSPLNINEENRGKVWFFKDVTLKIQAEEAIRRSEERFRSLVDILPDGVFLHDNFKIVYSNASSAELLGIEKASKLIGKDLLNFIHKNYHNVVKDIISREIKGERSKTFLELKALKSTGAEIDIEATSTIYFEDNRPMFITVLRDISERMETQKLQQKVNEHEFMRKKAEELDRLKTDFFSNISHELKTPLNIILGTIQLISVTRLKNEDFSLKDNKSLDRYIATMKQNCYRLLRLINNLIDITKLDSDYMQLQFSNNNIVSIVENITLSISTYANTKGISLVFDTESEEIITAFDPDQIERIMLNLLSNAIKFTGSGGIVEVSIISDEESIFISVKDTGVGIPEDMLAEVFSRFKRVDDLLTRRAEGSGIGLSLVEALVEAHGGVISAKSKVGHGSEFVIQLPIRLVDGEQLAKDEIASTEYNIEKIKIEFSDIYSID